MGRHRPPGVPVTPLVVLLIVGGVFLGVAAALSGDAVHVPWSEVDEIGAVVKLKRTAQELRLGRGDDKAARFVKRLPGA